MSYRNMDCPNCGRHRIELDGVCEKCQWDVDGNDYASITRPNEDEPDHLGEYLKNRGLGGGDTEQ